MWDTTKHAVCPYHHGDFLSMPHGGDSWNQYARLDRPYLDEDRLLREDLSEELPETLEAGEDYLDGADCREVLVEAVLQADEGCGSCGCEYDALYKRFLVLVSEQ